MSLIPHNTHHFFGPGESDYNKTSLDHDDFIAKIHDLRYELATSFKDKHESDLEAVKDFWKDFKQTAKWNSINWHDLVGAGGLGLKYLLEDIFNFNIYPLGTKAGKPLNAGQIAYAKRQWKAAQLKRLEEEAKKRKIRRTDSKYFKSRTC